MKPGFEHDVEHEVLGSTHKHAHNTTGAALPFAALLSLPYFLHYVSVIKDLQHHRQSEIQTYMHLC